jgi:hypothetical protein
MRRPVVILTLLFAAPVAAQEHPSHTRVQAPGHNPLDCYCRAQGRIFAPGESICLRTAEGPRVAECQMVTNVMSWNITPKLCPES